VFAKRCRSIYSIVALSSRHAGTISQCQANHRALIKVRRRHSASSNSAASSLQASSPSIQAGGRLYLVTISQCLYCPWALCNIQTRRHYVAPVRAQSCGPYVLPTALPANVSLRTCYYKMSWPV
jgi:hypothetical protein